MSGRKSSEVAAVLEKAEKNRAASEANYASAVKQHLNQLRREAEQINKCVHDISVVGAAVSAEAKKELASEAELLTKEMQTLIKQAVPGVNGVQLASRMEEQHHQNQTRLQKLDQRAQNVRDAIRRKRNGWYCDDEYAEAQRIQADMKNLSNDKTALLHELESSDQEVEGNYIRLRSLLEKKKRLEEQIAALNKRASEIVKLRQEAGAARNAVNEQFSRIDAKIAQKFLKQEYNALTAAIASFSSLGDAETIRKMQPLMSRIGEFSVQLEALYSAWKAAKANAEQRIASVEAFTREGKYYHPKEYLKDPDSANAISMFDFLSMYKDDSYETEYNALMQQAKKSLDAEKFDECCQHLEQAETLLRTARDYANVLQSKLIGSFQLALDTRDIMHATGFKVKTAFANGKNAVDGFVIKCTLGDESIDFTKVDVSEDGSVTMEIDHKEGAGSCGSSWKTLQGAFNEAGIPITDVKKNGHSVIYPGVTGTKTGNGQVQPGGH